MHLTAIFSAYCMVAQVANWVFSILLRMYMAALIDSLGKSYWLKLTSDMKLTNDVTPTSHTYGHNKLIVSLKARGV